MSKTLALLIGTFQPPIHGLRLVLLGVFKVGNHVAAKILSSPYQSREGRFIGAPPETFGPSPPDTQRLLP